MTCAITPVFDSIPPVYHPPGNAVRPGFRRLASHRPDAVPGASAKMREKRARNSWDDPRISRRFVSSKKFPLPAHPKISINGNVFTASHPGGNAVLKQLFATFYSSHRMPLKRSCEVDVNVSLSPFQSEPPSQHPPAPARVFLALDNCSLMGFKCRPAYKNNSLRAVLKRFSVCIPETVAMHFFDSEIRRKTQDSGQI